MTLNVAGTVTQGDVVAITLNCPSSGTAMFNSVDNNSTTLATGGTGITWTSSVTTNATGCSVLSLRASTVPSSGVVNPVVSVGTGTPKIELDTSGVTGQALSFSGEYLTLGAASTSFTVPSLATVLWYTVSSNVPAVTLGANTTTPISNLSITQPANINTALAGSGTTLTSLATTSTGGTAPVSYSAASADGTTISGPSTVPNATENQAYSASPFTVSLGTGVASFTASATGLPAGLSLQTSGNSIYIIGTPTATASGATVTITATDANAQKVTATITNFAVNATSVANSSLTVTLPTGDTWAGTPSVTISSAGTTVSPSISGAVLTLALSGTTPPTSNSTLIQVSGLSVTTTTGSSTGAQFASIDLGSTLLAKSVSVGTILGSTTRIYGQTPDATVAQEFEHAFPVNSTVSPATGGNANVVLATDVDPYDALSASYLEGQLHTGLLITPPTSFGSDAMNAMRLEGVQTVYVVGGPKAIAPSVLSQIQSTPAYEPGGLVPTGSMIKVVGPIYGTTAVDTAQKISTYFGTSYGTAQFAGAYSAASATTGGGAYNDTTGSASTSGPTSSTSTAIVLSGTDWRDAMSIAPEAYALRLPVVLTSDTSLSAQASAALTSLGAKQVIVVGGQLALTNSVVTSIQALNGGISVLRIAGQDATDTAAQLANFALAASPDGLAWSTSTVLASHANYWSDALGAAPLGGNANPTTFGYEPIILVKNPTTVGTYTTNELPKLSASGISKMTVLGGPLAMPSSTVSALQAGLAG